MIIAREKNWYEKTFTNIHYDHHSSGADGEGSGVNEEGIRRCWEIMRPDMVQYHSKGHHGYALYPTVHGVTSPGLVGDPLAVYSRIAKAMGIRFSIYYSIWLDEVQDTLHPNWRQVDVQGNPYKLFEMMHGYSLCIQSPYLEKVVYPMLAELMNRYDPDGFWFDGDIWGQRACWCERCTVLFTKEYGVSAPRKDGSELGLFYKFHFEQWHRYLKRTRNYIHDLKRGCLFSSNWSFTLRHPEDPEELEAVDYLSGDVDFNLGGSLSGSVEARALSSKNFPFDLMAYNQNHDFNTGKSGYKSVAQMLQQAVTICANGGNYFQWINPNPDDSLNFYEHRKCSEIFNYIKKYKEVFTDTRSAADMAILYSHAGDYAVALEHNNWNFIGSVGSAPVVRAVHTALTSAGYYFDIITDRGSKSDFQRYRTLILPETPGLTEACWEQIKHYVFEGGTLLLSPRALTAMDCKDEVEKMQGGRVLLEQGKVIQLAIDPESGEWDELCLEYTASAQFGFQATTAIGDFFYTDLKQDLIQANNYGKGRVITFTADLFRALTNDPTWSDQRVLEKTMKKYAQTDFFRGGRFPIECIVRRKEQRMFIHLINYSFDHFYDRGHTSVRNIPPIYDIPLTLNVEEPVHRVFAFDGEVEMEFKLENGCLLLTVPKLEIHKVIVIEFA